MNYPKTIKRLARKKGYTLRHLKCISGIGKETNLRNPSRTIVSRFLSALEMSQEQFYLELLRDSELPIEIRLKIIELTNKYFN